MLGLKLNHVSKKDPRATCPIASRCVPEDIGDFLHLITRSYIEAWTKWPHFTDDILKFVFLFVWRLGYLFSFNFTESLLTINMDMIRRWGYKWLFHFLTYRKSSTHLIAMCLQANKCTQFGNICSENSLRVCVCARVINLIIIVSFIAN